MTKSWWQSKRIKQDLIDTIAFLNRARARERFVKDERERLRVYYEMTLKLSRMYKRSSGKSNLSNQASLYEILFRSLDVQLSDQFCESVSMMRFVMMAPALVEPAISDPLMKASRDWMLNKAVEHKKLFIETFTTALIAASEKIAFDKSKRRQVFYKTNKRRVNIVKTLEKVLFDLIEVVLDHPSKNLVIYGSLAPGEVHAHVLRYIKGSWAGATIQGTITNEDKYPVFTWIPAGKEHEVYFFRSDDLPFSWRRIDNFEGGGYIRTWTNARLADGDLVVSNVYHAKHKASSR